MDTNPNTGNTKRRGRKVTEEKPQKITIEVSRYKSLMDALDNDSKMWRIVLTIFLCGVLLFSGITVVVISIKSFYPYSDISTNALGVTTLKNEKKEISYWLFNTAELWAKSGIKVKKGQTITVRASGKKHTAVHHLYKDADSNASRLNEPWVGTKGFATNEYSRKARDIYRSKYRVFPEENQDALLMQIVRNGKEPDTRPSAALPDKECKFSYADSENRFLLIGDKQENIYIEEDGELYFAINDIVTDDLTICRMMYEITTKKDDYNDYEVIPYLNNADLLRKDFHTKLKDSKNNADSLREATYKNFKDIFGFKDDDTANVFGFGKNDKGEFELFGYFIDNYETPWYDDNIGSFLIVVEISSE